MNELDEFWAEMIVDSRKKAAHGGREDLLNYLDLRSTNDAIRAAGIGWLFDNFIAIAIREQQRLPAIAIEREDPHRFARGTSHMVGSLIEVRLGVRSIKLLGGWARTPSDGVMHQGALAFARVEHFGMPDRGDEFRLEHAAAAEGSLPKWTTVKGETVTIEVLERHFAVFLDR